MDAMNASAESILEGLDEAQRLAATTVQGPVRIIAGAGAGKTRTVTRRIAYACASGRWDERKVLAVTFSVKAAAEMRSRLAALSVGEGVKAATFHSAALHQLRRVWSDISDSYFPTVIRDPQACLDRALKRVIAGDNPFHPVQMRDLLHEVDWCKVSLIAPEDYPRVCSALHRQPPAGIDSQRFADIAIAYEQEKTNRGEIDFNDILLIACHVMDDFPEAARTIRSSIGWLTVDEYQDVSPLQHRLMKLWLNGNTNVCVVGDPAQTIYSFAGASSYDLLHFSEEFAPFAADVNLATDYRSTPEVVNCANTVLQAAPNREDYLILNAVRPKGARVLKIAYDHDVQEAMDIAQRIAQWKRQGVSLDDCAILTRINNQQSVIARALYQEGLKYRVRRDSGWQQSALDVDGSDKEIALAAHGIAREEAVTISTIHASKGLEFKHVFIVGCSEGLMPYGSPDPGDDLEEERRLMYVGITRAQDSLQLSFARSKEQGGAASRQGSRFLA